MPKPLKTVQATRGKWVRAEPVAAMNAQGRVKHVDPPLAELEDPDVRFRRERTFRQHFARPARRTGVGGDRTHDAAAAATGEDVVGSNKRCGAKRIAPRYCRAISSGQTRCPLRATRRHQLVRRPLRIKRHPDFRNLQRISRRITALSSPPSSERLRASLDSSATAHPLAQALCGRRARHFHRAWLIQKRKIAQ